MPVEATSHAEIGAPGLGDRRQQIDARLVAGALAGVRMPPGEVERREGVVDEGAGRLGRRFHGQQHAAHVGMAR